MPGPAACSARKVVVGPGGQAGAAGQPWAGTAGQRHKLVHSRKDCAAQEFLQDGRGRTLMRWRRGASGRRDHVQRAQKGPEAVPWDAVGQKVKEWYVTSGEQCAGGVRRAVPGTDGHQVKQSVPGEG